VAQLEQVFGSPQALQFELIIEQELQSEGVAVGL
jgi:hypothetical protein